MARIGSQISPVRSAAVFGCADLPYAVVRRHARVLRRGFQRVLEEAADRLREAGEVAEASEGVIQGMMGYKGRR